MARGSFHSAIVFALLSLGVPNAATAADAVDQLMRGGQVPTAMIHDHGHSDFFADPVGRFLDLLAAGAFTDARALQPDACRTWLATREHSAWTGKFRVWETEIDLNTLCAPG